MRNEPTSGITRQQAEGRAWGAIFFSGFGELWLMLGMRQSGWGWPVTVLACAGTAGLLSFTIRALLQRSATLPSVPPSAEDDLRATRMFNAVNIIQWVSVATAIGVLNVLHMPQYIAAAVAIIVGLHLFPLAGAFHQPLHYVTGTALIAWPLACLLLTSAAAVSGIVALGAGVILLVSAAFSLQETLARTRAQAT